MDIIDISIKYQLFEAEKPRDGHAFMLFAMYRRKFMKGSRLRSFGLPASLYRVSQDKKQDRSQDKSQDKPCFDPCFGLR
jgi:hypothetical protein